MKEFFQYHRRLAILLIPLLGAAVLLPLATLRFSPIHATLVLIGYHKDIPVVTAKMDASCSSYHSLDLSPDLRAEFHYCFTVLGTDVWRFSLREGPECRTVTLLNRGHHAALFKSGRYEYCISKELPK